ncbi:EPIDERMAL PATTERNING FACTOR-like protein 2 [Oryza brachyantha]|uniref:Epidermal patterning factor-like protein n=1 Tax=Oryza brachyantha TaxID=4533 RepID=J3LRI0_ORYBR|nr:EPIDERMAL PATTERNING FACTOR-like protein 2 [Oryza brachyantha]
MGHLSLLLLAILLLLASSVVHARAAAFTEEKGVAGIRGVIGSRPPSCEGRCRSCGHCEAVQVPISPQELQKKRGGDARRKKKKLAGHGDRAAAAAGGGRGATPDSYDDHSNYKPLSWRCKCGGLILNP